MANRLVDLEALEVSLVPEGANQRKFLLLKSLKGGKEKMSELIERTLAKDLKFQEKLNKILKQKQMDEEDKEYYTAIAKIIDEIDKSDVNILKEIFNLIPGLNMDLGKGGVKKEVEIKKQDIDISQELEELTDEEVELLYGQIRGLWTRTGADFLLEIGNSIIASMVAREMEIDFDDPFIEASDFAEGPEEGEVMMSLSKIEKSIKNVPESIRKEIKKVYKEKQEILKQLREKEDEELKMKFVQKAKEEFANMPVEKEEFGLLLKNLKESVPEDYEKIEQIFKTINGVLSENTELFKELGSSNSTEDDGKDNWTKIEKKAESILKDGMTKEQAINKVLEENPELYKAYLNETGHQ